MIRDLLLNRLQPCLQFLKGGTVPAFAKKNRISRLRVKTHLAQPRQKRLNRSSL